MKLLNTLRLIFCILVGILFLFSCRNGDTQKKILDRAYLEFNSDKPDVALSLLDSIGNPKSLGDQNYMKYIVVYTAAKYETKQDVGTDNLIMEASRYFNHNEDPAYTPLANYYAGQLYKQRKNLTKAVEAYLYAADNSGKSGNKLLESKSFNNIGHIYFQKELNDSAIVYCKKALYYYKDSSKIDERELKILTNIGRAFEDVNLLDSASIYYNKILDDAKKIGNEKYESYSLQNLGILCFRKNEYEKSIHYFQSALALKVTDDEQIRNIGINILRIYNAKHSPELAKQYAELVETRLPQVTYIYTLKDIYAALADFYTQSGDYKKAVEYQKMETTALQQINKEANPTPFLEVSKNYQLAQQERYNARLTWNLYFIVMFAGVVIIGVLILSFFIYRMNRKAKAKAYDQAVICEQMKRKLDAERLESEKALAELKRILEDDSDGSNGN